eukprot:Skav229678  [mRNA]  locus=scaffold4264:106603:107261:+ [translate_table: standard]
MEGRRGHILRLVRQHALALLHQALAGNTGATALGGKDKAMELSGVATGDGPEKPKGQQSWPTMDSGHGALFQVGQQSWPTAQWPLFTGNMNLTNNRNGTMRSAIFWLTCAKVHVLENFADMLGGPGELNSEGYLFGCIHWTSASGMVKGWSMSIVEE